MKISTQEEYGLRILLQIAKSENGLCISDIAKLENLTVANTAKICRLLRISGYINSSKGKDGGYYLNLPPQEIKLDELMARLDTPLYSTQYCERFCEEGGSCLHSVNCQVKTVWMKMQNSINTVLREMTLSDLIHV